MAKNGRVYKIGEAARMLGLNTSVLRFWEDEFPQLKPGRTPKGQRLYSQEDMVLLGRIRGLLHDRGMTIEGAKRVLDGAGVPRLRKEKAWRPDEAGQSPYSGPQDLVATGEEGVAPDPELIRYTLAALDEVRKMLAEPAAAKPERREPEKKRQLSLLHISGGGA